MDGAGIKSHLEDTVYRRNRSIGDIPECIKKAHIRVPAGSQNTRHFLPVLSHATFVCAIKEVGDIKLVYADSKANTTVVRLANHYGCSVLCNDTNYCVFDIAGGVIFFKYLTLDPGLCSAYVVNRKRLFQAHFKLNDLTLVFAMVAILGDGGDMSVPSLYYGRSPLKSTIDARPGVEGGRNWPLNVSQFLRSFGNLEEFKCEITTNRVFANVKSQLRENCLKAERQYNISSTINIEDVCDITSIKCSYPCDVPSPVLQQFRNGALPNFLMDAIAMGQACLCQQVGDLRQPPVVMLGSPVRAAAYGFASGLMNQSNSESITEYHRNTAGAQQKLNYSAHVVKPVCVQRELMVTNIAQIDEMSRNSLAKQAICTILECTWDKISVFDNDAEKSWMLVVALTQLWARHQLRNRQLSNADRVIRSMVYSFVRCSSEECNNDDQLPLSDASKDSRWIKAYHAALEWQCLYSDTIGLNAILLHPFEVQSPACLYDGEVIMHYAICGGVEAQVECLSPTDRELYDKLLAAILPA